MDTNETLVKLEPGRYVAHNRITIRTLRATCGTDWPLSGYQVYPGQSFAIPAMTDGWWMAAGYLEGGELPKFDPISDPSIDPMPPI